MPIRPNASTRLLLSRQLLDRNIELLADAMDCIDPGPGAAIKPATDACFAALEADFPGELPHVPAPLVELGLQAVPWFRRAQAHLDRQAIIALRGTE